MVVHQPLRPPEPDSCRSHAELASLAATCAIRVRELSDAVATLGREIAARREIEETIIEVKRLRTLAQQASEDLLGALESPKSRVTAASD